MKWTLKSGRREPAQESESARAKRVAHESLQESLRDREEVFEISRQVRYELARNHISQRIAILLKEGK